MCGKILEILSVEGAGEVKFRYPKIDDAEKMREHINSLRNEETDFLKKDKIRTSEELDFIENHISNIENEKEIMLVVELDGEIKGHGEVFCEEDSLPRVGNLGIGLKKEIRGKGVGKKLLETLIREAEKKLGIKVVLLKVFQTNKVAIKLYRKNGFKKIFGIEDGAYHQSEHKNMLIMGKDLQSES